MLLRAASERCCMLCSLSSGTTALAKLRQRRRVRGMVSLSVLLEAGAFMAWWTWIVAGQKHVADASAARRSVDYGATDAALIANASACGQAVAPRQPALANYTSQVDIQKIIAGKLEIGSLISLVSAVAIGKQPSFEIFLKPFTNVNTGATTGEVEAPPLLGGGNQSFTAKRRTACLEPSKDSPKTSVADYRKSVFSLIEGY